MAPEHLRRVLAANPGLPQGEAEAEGGTRWFSATEVVRLRSHFAKASGGRRHVPVTPDAAPLVALAQPLGAAGRSTAVLHLAVAAALAGWRVLVVDGDPSGRLGRDLGAAIPAGAGMPQGAGVLSLLAKSAAQHLRRANEGLLDRGEAPLPMPDLLAACLPLNADDLIAPSRWPGLDVMPAPPALLQADVQIAAWQSSQRTWRAHRALPQILADEGLRRRYDLILLDVGRGLGPLAVSVLAGADVLVAPFVVEAGLAPLGLGLAGLDPALKGVQTEEAAIARALGRPLPAPPAQTLLVLPVRARADAPARLAGFAAKLGDALLPAPLPEIARIASGQSPGFYDIDYRETGRLAYGPHRDACEAVWRQVAARLTR